MPIHILNGDALRMRLPESISGEIIVMRECLVDGPVNGFSVEELIANRRLFFAENYAVTASEYQLKTQTELQKITKLNNTDEIYLWFEFDLFCQVNMWFVCYLLNSVSSNNSIYWVQPDLANPYSFAHMSNEELSTAYRDPIQLSHQDIQLFSQLWQAYQIQAHDEMLQLIATHVDKFPQLESVIIADRERNLSNSELGRPEKVLVQIMQDLKTKEFGPVFREFCAREGIYSFGDLQVKRLFEQLV